MIEVVAGEAFQASLVGGAHGIGGTITVQVVRAPSTVISTQVGVVESTIVNGLYAATLIAPVDPGNYLIVWLNTGATPTPTEDLVVEAAQPVYGAGSVTYVPFLSQVANILRARTITDQSSEAGTFNANTRPNGTQAQAMIDLAANDVLPELGPTVPAPFLLAAQNLVALRAAMYIELSYFPEQIASGISPYASYEKLYNDQLKKLTVSIEDYNATGSIDIEDTDGMPIYSFPVATGLESRIM